MSGYVDLQSLRCQNQISKQFEGTLPANLTNILPSAEDQTTLIELLASQTFEAVSQFVHKCGCQYYGEKQLPAVRGREEEFLIAAIQHAQHGKKAPTDEIFDILKEWTSLRYVSLASNFNAPDKAKAVMAALAEADEWLKEKVNAVYSGLVQQDDLQYLPYQQDWRLWGRPEEEA